MKLRGILIFLGFVVLAAWKPVSLSYGETAEPLNMGTRQGAFEETALRRAGALRDNGNHDSGNTDEVANRQGEGDTSTQDKISGFSKWSLLENGEGVETGRLGLKAAFGYFPLFANGESKAMRGRISMEFQRPVITADGRLKWLVSGALAYMGISDMRILRQACNTPSPPWRGLSSEFFRPDPPKPPFDSPFFQKNYQEKLKKYNQRVAEYNRKRENQRGCGDTESQFYLGAQTGMAYDLGPVDVSFLGGAFINHKGGFGYTGRLGFGGALTDMSAWEAGLSAVHYGRLYWGMDLSVSFFLKKWVVRLSNVF